MTFNDLQKNPGFTEPLQREPTGLSRSLVIQCLQALVDFAPYLSFSAILWTDYVFWLLPGGCYGGCLIQIKFTEEMVFLKLKFGFYFSVKCF